MCTIQEKILSFSIFHATRPKWFRKKSFVSIFSRSHYLHRLFYAQYSFSVPIYHAAIACTLFRLYRYCCCCCPQQAIVITKYARNRFPLLGVSMTKLCRMHSTRSLIFFHCHRSAQISSSSNDILFSMLNRHEFHLFILFLALQTNFRLRKYSLSFCAIFAHRTLCVCSALCLCTRAAHIHAYALTSKQKFALTKFQ